MRSSTRRRVAELGLALVLGVASTSAFAQTTPTRVRGTIGSVDGSTLVVRAREGGEVTLKMPEPPRISAVVRKTIADITPGSFIGTAGVPLPDGTVGAVAISILPESAKASGGFHGAWDLTPESTMTNATVAEAVKAVSGETLKVTYKDGEKTIRITPETAIVGAVPGAVAELKPGVRVVVFAARAPDGSMSAGNVLIGRDGVDPPM